LSSLRVVTALPQQLESRNHSDESLASYGVYWNIVRGSQVRVFQDGEEGNGREEEGVVFHSKSKISVSESEY
jgi:hypothetical protein